jgi:hypothetical protein
MELPPECIVHNAVHSEDKPMAVIITSDLSFFDVTCSSSSMLTRLRQTMNTELFYTHPPSLVTAVSIVVGQYLLRTLPSFMMLYHDGLPISIEENGRHSSFFGQPHLISSPPPPLHHARVLINPYPRLHSVRVNVVVHSQYYTMYVFFITS